MSTKLLISLYHDMCHYWIRLPSVKTLPHSLLVSCPGSNPWLGGPRPKFNFWEYGKIRFFAYWSIEQHATINFDHAHTPDL